MNLFLAILLHVVASLIVMFDDIIGSIGSEQVGGVVYGHAGIIYNTVSMKEARKCSIHHVMM